MGKVTRWEHMGTGIHGAGNTGRQQEDIGDNKS